MPNNYLSVLYKHIIQVGNKNVGLKVWGRHRDTIATLQSKLDQKIWKTGQRFRFTDTSDGMGGGEIN